MLLQSPGEQCPDSLAASVEMRNFACFREPIAEFVFVRRPSTVQVCQGLWCKLGITLWRCCMSVLIPGKSVKVAEDQNFPGVVGPLQVWTYCWGSQREIKVVLHVLLSELKQKENICTTCMYRTYFNRKRIQGMTRLLLIKISQEVVKSQYFRMDVQIVFGGGSVLITRLQKVPKFLFSELFVAETSQLIYLLSDSESRVFCQALM